MCSESVTENLSCTHSFSDWTILCMASLENLSFTGFASLFIVPGKTSFNMKAEVSVLTTPQIVLFGQLENPQLWTRVAVQQAFIHGRWETDEIWVWSSTTQHERNMKRKPSLLGVLRQSYICTKLNHKNEGWVRSRQIIIPKYSLVSCPLHIVFNVSIHFVTKAGSNRMLYSKSVRRRPEQHLDSSW